VVILPQLQTGDDTTLYAGNQTLFVHVQDLNLMQVQVTKQQLLLAWL
jgi:hypothetical protein